MVGNKRLGDREGCTASGPEGTWRDEEAALALSEARIELEWERSGGAKIVTERRGAPGGSSGGDATVPAGAVSGLAAPDATALGSAAPAAETTATATPDTADSSGAATHDAGSGPRQPTPHADANADAELAEPTALHDHPITGASVVRPAQLPAAVADFTGRADAVRQLSELLTVGGGGEQAVLAIAGTGGIGKTTLAVHVAHAARRHFPDGQLYIDLRGAGPSPAEPEAALGAFLRSLGTPDAAIPDGAEERAALYRSALKSRRALILLDNARDAAQIRPLLPGDDAGGCAALITSRTNMAGLAGSRLVDLDVMSPAEAFALFARIVGEERASVERDEVMDVLASCGFLPLAIRIAACRLASRRTWAVSVLARKLADERRRLDELRAGDLAVKASFELGYGQLEPQQARAFRLLGLADGPDISLPAAAAVLDLDDESATALLASLVDISLLEPGVPGRYRFHDLVRLYARACAEREEDQASEREAVLSRQVDFYLATASRVYAVERPGERTIDHFEPTCHPGLRFESSAAALDWLFTEADCLMTCVRQCTGPGTRRRAGDLLMAALDLAESGARSRQYEAAAQAVADAAHTAGDFRTEARARSALGHLYVFTGRFSEAELELRGALELAASDPIVACRSLNQLGILALGQGRHKAAEAYLSQALDAYRADGNEVGEASALSNLARVHVNSGRTRSGVELAEQGLDIYRRLGAPLRLANGMYSLGIALTRAHRFEEALVQLTEALAIFKEARQPLWEGMTHFRLAETHLAANHPAKALVHAERSLALGGFGGESRRSSFLAIQGKALSALGHRDRAVQCWREAYAICERLGSPELEEVRRLLSPGTPNPPDISDLLLGHTDLLHGSGPLTEREPPS
ncbi:regulatory protein [Streptomyces bingchenggensis BCW-1]|uniref:Regulatory protein n=1 Tax=Streptomyces bingchenggensis (strain BCW-1) TaxID=749414 RepID=D7BSC4_STRBB|nr:MULTISPECIES: tetratricopeptide repeat protein [Streptomyces]ADI09442.1 regulatory protein [Streptomyces bingchenggensis BCW-1]